MADTVRAGTSLGLEPRTADISRAAAHARNAVVGAVRPVVERPVQAPAVTVPTRSVSRTWADQIRLRDGQRASGARRSSPAVGAPRRRRAVSSASVWLRRPKRGPCVARGRIPSGNTSGCPDKPVDQQLHAHRPGRELQRLGRQHRPAGRRCAVKTCNFLIRLCAAAQQAVRRTFSARPSPHTPARRLPAGAARKGRSTSTREREASA